MIMRFSNQTHLGSAESIVHRIIGRRTDREPEKERHHRTLHTYIATINRIVFTLAIFWLLLLFDARQNVMKINRPDNNHFWIRKKHNCVAFLYSHTYSNPISIQSALSRLHRIFFLAFSTRCKVHAKESKSSIEKSISSTNRDMMIRTRFRVGGVVSTPCVYLVPFVSNYECVGTVS